MKFPTPRNQKQLKGFLGLTNFYNSFTDKYAETTRPVSYTHLDVYKRQLLSCPCHSAAMEVAAPPHASLLILQLSIKLPHAKWSCV